MRKPILFLILIIPVFAAAQTTPPPNAPQKFKLPATPKTVAWGYYDAAAPPVLRIHSGDTVVFDTLITNSPTGLEKAGLPPEQVEQSLRDIYKEVTNKGPGGHILNGPVFVEEAEPGDTLEVRIVKIDLAIPYAYNAFGPTRGFLPEDFPYRRMKIIPLDRETHDRQIRARHRGPTTPVLRQHGSGPAGSFWTH